LRVGLDFVPLKRLHFSSAQAANRVSSLASPRALVSLQYTSRISISLTLILLFFRFNFCSKAGGSHALTITGGRQSKVLRVVTSQPSRLRLGRNFSERPDECDGRPAYAPSQASLFKFVEVRLSPIQVGSHWWPPVRQLSPPTLQQKCSGLLDWRPPGTSHSGRSHMPWLLAIRLAFGSIHRMPL
jgi:hypothetical protein